MSREWIPRILITGAKSGSGKTIVTCGLMRLLKRRGMAVAGFKCGPDYIDPMFHREVLEVESGNLDGFFQTGQQMRESFQNGCLDAGKKQGKPWVDISVIEGAMGYFDGLGGITAKASSWETAERLNCPVLFVADGQGSGLSLAAEIQGFLEFSPTGKTERKRENNGISGILLNRVSPGLYPELKAVLEERFSIPVVGYVPKFDWLEIQSRHLGLKMPEEIQDLQQQLDRLSEELERTIDVDRLLQMAENPVKCAEEELAWSRERSIDENAGGSRLKDSPVQTVFLKREKTPVIGVARDEAFCFYYPDNLRLLERLGAELVFFSPIHDTELPKKAGGLIFGGGYPELYGRMLSENIQMRQQVFRAGENGIPILGECGGFLYLQESLEDENGISYPMTGVLPGHGYRKGKLGRFGYIVLRERTEGFESGEAERADGIYLKAGERILAHEFHYWDSDCCGEQMEAKKPVGKRSWLCMQQRGMVLAGFPHLYYPSCVEFARRFVEFAGGMGNLVV